MGWVDRERGKRGIYIVFKIFFEPFFFRRSALFRGLKYNLFRAQPWYEFVGPNAVFVLCEGGSYGANLAELLARPTSKTPDSNCCSKPATRISKNSSRLLLTIERNLTLSKSGKDSSRQRLRTLLLNASQLSSRLKYFFSTSFLCAMVCLQCCCGRITPFNFSLNIGLKKNKHKNFIRTFLNPKKRESASGARPPEDALLRRELSLFV